MRFHDVWIGMSANVGEAGPVHDGGDRMGRVAQVHSAEKSGHSGVSRLVIADDHPLFRIAIRQMVEDWPDLELVGEASDGMEIVEVCLRERPDLVLMDLWMPRKNGFEATREIKRESPSTSVLVLTAFEEPDYLLEALKAGASGYVLKYMSPQQIAVAIRRVLEGEFPLNQEVTMQLLVRLIEDSQNKRDGISPSLPMALSSREFEVLVLLARGQSNQQISRELFISISTVKNHVHHIIEKLGVSDRVQAAVLAIERGWVTLR
ncbi:MAG TPA: response regulator transcription factor [Rubrobacter sp.]|nr:response regulator transcription factor [Rubrobacter sp.]